MSEEGTESVHDFLKGPLYGLCDICKGDFMTHLNRAYAERNEARREYEGPMAEEITNLRGALTDALDWIRLAPDDGQPLKFHELALSELRRKHGDLIVNPPSPENTNG